MKSLDLHVDTLTYTRRERNNYTYLYIQCICIYDECNCLDILKIQSLPKKHDCLANTDSSLENLKR